MRILVSSSLILVLGAMDVYAQTCRTDIVATAPDLRFRDNGNGTVTDIVTGLMWKQCAEGLSGSGCASGNAAGFSWQQALQRASDVDFAGYSDWKLPDRGQLASIVEERCYNPAINSSFFPNTPVSHFWSASPDAGSPSKAWYLNSYTGGIGQNAKNLAKQVRLVRTGQ